MVQGVNNRDVWIVARETFPWGKPPTTLSSKYFPSEDSSIISWFSASPFVLIFPFLSSCRCRALLSGFSGIFRKSADGSIRERRERDAFHFFPGGRRMQCQRTAFISQRGLSRMYARTRAAHSHRRVKMANAFWFPWPLFLSLSFVITLSLSPNPELWPQFSRGCVECWFVFYVFICVHRGESSDHLEKLIFDPTCKDSPANLSLIITLVFRRRCTCSPSCTCNDRFIHMSLIWVILLIWIKTMKNIRLNISDDVAFYKKIKETGCSLAKC